MMWSFQCLAFSLPVYIYASSLISSTHGAASHPRLWHYGCYRKNESIATSINSFNSPGNCLDNCQTAKFIALQNESCMCLDGHVPHEWEEWGNCKSVCPGNPYQYCGKTGDGDVVSVYYVETNATESLDKCDAINCTTNDLFEESCEVQYVAYLGKKPPKTSGSRPELDEKTNSQVNWIHVYDETGTHVWNVGDRKFDPKCWTGNNRHCITIKCVTGWLRVFSQYAPVVCKSPDVENTTLTTNGHAQVGDWANYTCLPGYMFESGDLSRQCQSDGTWDGTDPVCTKTQTTSSPNTNSTESSTSRTTVTTDESWKLRFIVVVISAAVEGLIIIVFIVIILKLNKLRSKTSVVPEETGSPIAANPLPTVSSSTVFHQGPAKDRFDVGNAPSPCSNTVTSNGNICQNGADLASSRRLPVIVTQPAAQDHVPEVTLPAAQDHVTEVTQPAAQDHVPEAGEEVTSSPNVVGNKRHKRDKHSDETPEERKERKRKKKEKKERKKREKEERREQGELERMNQEELERRDQEELG